MLPGKCADGNRADILRRKCRDPRWAPGSGIEALASVIVVWRFTGSRMVSETSERRAQRAVAVSFWLLDPTSRSRPFATWPHITQPVPRRGSGGLDRVDAFHRAGLQSFGFDDVESGGLDGG